MLDLGPFLSMILMFMFTGDSECQLLSSLFAWSDDLDLPCHRYPGSCLHFDDVKSVSDCQQTCVGLQTPCLSFSYRWTSGVCTVSNMSSEVLPAGYADLVSSENVTLFQMTRGEALKLFEKWPNSVLPLPNSYKTTLKNTSLNVCAEECTKNSHFRCLSFAFNSALKSCLLSDSRTGLEGGKLLFDYSLDYYEYRRNELPCNVSIPLTHSGSLVIASPNYPYGSLSQSTCVTSLWINSGFKVKINVTWMNFDIDVCHNDGEGIRIYSGDSELIGQICKKNMSETFSFSDITNVQILTVSKSTSIQYQATLIVELNGLLASSTPSNISFDKNDSRCHNDTCANGGVCQEISETLLCTCPAGYTGATCENFIDLCRGDTCQNGRCLEVNDTYVCLCEDGYTGRHCETDINECQLNDVCPESACLNVPGDYRCVCPQCQFGLCVYTGSKQSCQCFPGFMGNNCSEEINECDDDTSCHHGNCTDYVNGVECNCDDGYTGRRCDVKIIHPCDGDPCECGNCIIIEDDFLCECPIARKGKLCENFGEVYNSIINANDLITNFCNVSTCEIRLRTKCEFGFMNYFYTIKNSYANISIESVKIDKHTLVNIVVACNEKEGSQTRSECELVIAMFDMHSISDILLLRLDCEKTNCKNSTTIFVESLIHLKSPSDGDLLVCLPLLIEKMDELFVQTYISRSSEKYLPTSLVSILYKLSRADDSTIQNVAMNLIAQIKFLMCLDFPKACDISPVDTMSCVHIKNTYYLVSKNPKPSERTTLTPFSTTARYVCTNEDCVNGYCLELGVSPYCWCEAGFTGQRCDVNICDTQNCRNCGATSENDSSACLCDSGNNCKSTNRTCEHFPCLHGKCELDKNLVPYCNCKVNFAGKFCEIRIPPCDLFVCVHGNCSIDSYGFPECKCGAGFTGNHCQHDETSCNNRPCIHGNCTTEVSGGFSCSCHDGYTGRLCEQRIPLCNSSCYHGDCLQNGSCQCHEGYDGIHCDQDPPVDGSNNTGSLFDYALWSLIAVIALLVVSTVIMAACVKVKRSRGEFSFHHLRKTNSEDDTRPRLVNSRDINEDLRREYYLSPTLDLDPECLLSQPSPSSRILLSNRRETGSGVGSDHTTSSEAYRRYSVPDDGHLSMHNLSSRATHTAVVLRYAELQGLDSSSTSSSQTHYGNGSQAIEGAAVGNSEA
ncbi:neurogenic locus notch homolog protein 1-like isoform X2 [Argopecten irradians]|uniref:neurogenic locus notch homolog protein 1-like isoform X2 n=1 Tax=Argopecten irradians TaxID=31199 RepID=UPI00371157E5